MFTFLLWCILLVLCWPVALAALVLYPIVWLLLLPFKLVGIAVGGVLALVWAIITLPAAAATHYSLTVQAAALYTTLNGVQPAVVGPVNVYAFGVNAAGNVALVPTFFAQTINP